MTCQVSWQEFTHSQIFNLRWRRCDRRWLCKLEPDNLSWWMLPNTSQGSWVLQPKSCQPAWPTSFVIPLMVWVGFLLIQLLVLHHFPHFPAMLHCMVCLFVVHKGLCLWRPSILVRGFGLRRGIVAIFASIATAGDGGPSCGYLRWQFNIVSAFAASLLCPNILYHIHWINHRVLHKRINSMYPVIG